MLAMKLMFSSNEQEYLLKTKFIRLILSKFLFSLRKSLYLGNY